VTPEEPQTTATRLQVLAEAKLIGGKHIRFLGQTSAGHERKFLEEAGSSFAIPMKRNTSGISAPPTSPLPLGIYP
jgi:hypothetical protein